MKIIGFAGSLRTGSYNSPLCVLRSLASRSELRDLKKAYESTGFRR